MLSWQSTFLPPFLRVHTEMQMKLKYWVHVCKSFWLERKPLCLVSCFLLHPSSFSPSQPMRHKDFIFLLAPIRFQYFQIFCSTFLFTANQWPGLDFSSISLDFSIYKSFARTYEILNLIFLGKWDFSVCKSFAPTSLPCPATPFFAPSHIHSQPLADSISLSQWNFSTCKASKMKDLYFQTITPTFSPLLASPCLRRRAFTLRGVCR